MSDRRENGGRGLAETGFELGDWSVAPALNRLSRGGRVVHLRPRVMDVLVYLARRPGEVVAQDEIVAALWAKEFLADTALTRAVFELREALGDDPRQPRYVATIPKRGYGLVAPVTPARAVAEPPPTDAQPPASALARLARPYVAALALTFLTAIAHPGHRSASASAPPTVRIAVLAFENLGAAADGFLAAGLADEIRSRLSSVSGVAVISHAGAERLPPSGTGERSNGAAPADEYVLSGTVRWDRAGARPERVRITPRLVRVADGMQVWAASYDGTIRDVLRFQADVAAAVITEVGVRFSASARARIKAPPTANAEAYQAFLRGLYHGANLYKSERDLRLGLQMFERAVQIDPEFANAWSSLSVLRSGMFHMGYDRTEACCAEARRAADRALALDPTAAGGRTSLGYYLYWCRSDYAGALNEFAAVRRSQGESAELWAAEGFVLRRLGRWDDAVGNFARAAALEPLDSDPDREWGLTAIAMRRFEQAEQHLKRAIGLDPDQVAPYGFLAQTYWLRSGDLASARLTLQAIPRPSDPWLGYWWYWQELFEGKYQDALERAERSDATIITNDVLTNGLTWDSRNLMLARAYALLGRAADALRAYEAARLEVEEQLRARPGEFALHGALGVALAGLGRGADAVRAGRKAVALMPLARDALDGTGPLLTLAEIEVATGDADGACRELRTLLTVPAGVAVPVLELDPRWAPLRSHPCYAALVRRAGPAGT